MLSRAATSRLGMLLRGQHLGFTPWLAQQGVEHTKSIKIARLWDRSTTGAVVNLSVYVARQAALYTATAFAGPVRADDHGSQERRCEHSNIVIQCFGMFIARKVYQCSILPRDFCCAASQGCRFPAFAYSSTTCLAPVQHKFSVRWCGFEE